MAKGIGAGIGAVAGGVAKGVGKLNTAIPGGFKGVAERAATGDPEAGKLPKVFKKESPSEKTTVKTPSGITATGGQDISTAGLGKEMPESIMAKAELPPPPGPPRGGGIMEKVRSRVKSTGKASASQELAEPPARGSLRIDRYDPN